MTTFYLIRHANTAAVGRRLVGRHPNVPLDDVGRSQLPALSAFLARAPLRAVYCSPLDRAAETARAVAEPHALDVRPREALTDIEFGTWSDRALSELSDEPSFRRFNSFRSGVAPPGGEHPVSVQSRLALELCRIRDTHHDEAVAVVGHADPLRAALAFFIGLPLDLARRLDIDPASVTRLELTLDDARLCYLNLSIGADGPRI